MSAPKGNQFGATYKKDIILFSTNDQLDYKMHPFLLHLQFIIILLFLSGQKKAIK